MELAIEKQTRDDGTVELVLTGELCVYTSGQLKREVVAAVQAEAPGIEVDLAGVNYLDCTGMGVLIGALKHLSDRGATLRLLRPSSQVGSIFHITGMSKVFTIDPPVTG